MLHKKLSSYLMEIEQYIENIDGVYIEKYQEEILTSERANLRLRLRFSTGDLLEVNEAIIIEQGQFKTLDYRYHAQDAANKILFRYDNTPHFPKLANFPHHKHLPKDTIASEKPDVIDVIRELLEE